MRKLILINMCLLFMAAIAMADDVQTPWWRGWDCTTSQLWEFFSPDRGPNLKPDGPAPGGNDPLPSTKLTVTPGPGMDWIEVDVVSGREGIWPLSGSIDIMVHNYNQPPRIFKWIWVQITWRPQDQGEIPILDNFKPMYDPRYPPKMVAEVDLGYGWLESTYDWRIYPNPPEEKFTISGTIDVDELVIDTWCVPEPATICLLGLGGLALLRKRRA